MALHTLGLAGYTIYRPQITETVARRRRRVDVHQSLFPCYAFVLIVDHWWSAMRSPGVGMDGAHPARVPDSIIDDLRRREQRDGYIRLPKPPGLQRGDRVLITRGPFADRIAIYAGMSGTQRVAVLLALLGGEKRVTLSKDNVVAI